MVLQVSLQNLQQEAFSVGMILQLLLLMIIFLYLLGCIKFLESYYLLLVTKRRQIGCICGHAIYGIDESIIIPIPHATVQTDVAHSKTELR